MDSGGRRPSLRSVPVYGPLLPCEYIHTNKFQSNNNIKIPMIKILQ